MPEAASPRWVMAAALVLASSALASERPANRRLVTRLPTRELLRVIDVDDYESHWVDQATYDHQLHELSEVARQLGGTGATIGEVHLTPNGRRLTAPLQPPPKKRSGWSAFLATPSSAEPTTWVVGKDALPLAERVAPGDGSLAVAQLDSPDRYRRGRYWTPPPDLLQRRRGLVRMEADVAQELWTAVREKTGESASTDVKRWPDAVSRDGRTAYFHFTKPKYLSIWSSRSFRVGKLDWWYAVREVDGRLDTQEVRPARQERKALKKAGKLTDDEAARFYMGPLSSSGMDEDPFALDP